MLKIKSEMLEKSSRSHASPKLLNMIITFIIVFLILFLLEGIPLLIASYSDLTHEFLKVSETGKVTFKQSMEITTKITSKPHFMKISLYSTILGTLTSMFYCRCIEMRSLESMGITKKKAVPHYLLGLVIGMSLFSLIILISAVTGVNDVKLCQNIKWSAILSFVPGWFFQGMSEEVVFRGYLATTVGGKHSPTTALAVSSIGFSLAHCANPGFNPLVFINLALFGLFAGLYLFLTENLWGCCAIHSIWNCVQGNFYGISVSGMEEMSSCFKTTAVSESVLLTGGDFGMEGSIFTTLVLGTTSFILFKLLQKKNADYQTAAK